MVPDIHCMAFVLLFMVGALGYNKSKLFPPSWSTESTLFKERYKSNINLGAELFCEFAIIRGLGRCWRPSKFRISLCMSFFCWPRSFTGVHVLTASLSLLWSNIGSLLFSKLKRVATEDVANVRQNIRKVNKSIVSLSLYHWISIQHFFKVSNSTKKVAEFSMIHNVAFRSFTFQIKQVLQMIQTRLPTYRSLHLFVDFQVCQTRCYPLFNSILIINLHHWLNVLACVNDKAVQQRRLLEDIVGVCCSVSLGKLKKMCLHATHTFTPTAIRSVQLLIAGSCRHSAGCTVRGCSKSGL